VTPPVVNPKGRIGCSFEEEAIPWPLLQSLRRKALEKEYPSKDIGDSDDLETDDDSDDDTSSPSTQTDTVSTFPASGVE
jgi:hypothetical protein